MRAARRQGISLIEVVIVLVVIAILATISSPFGSGATGEATTTVTRAHLRYVLFAELTHFSQTNRFTADRASLLAIEPGLPLGEPGTPGSIYINVSHSKLAPALCLFAEGAAGSWLTLYHSGRTGTTVDLYSPNDCTRRMIEEHGDPLDPGDRILDGDSASTKSTMGTGHGGPGPPAQ